MVVSVLLDAPRFADRSGPHAVWHLPFGGLHRNMASGGLFPPFSVRESA